MRRHRLRGQTAGMAGQPVETSHESPGRNPFQNGRGPAPVEAATRFGQDRRGFFNEAEKFERSMRSLAVFSRSAIMTQVSWNIDGSVPPTGAG